MGVVKKMNMLKKLLSSKRKVRVEFCQKNLDRFLTEKNFAEYNAFSNQKEIIYREYECQSRCKECKQSPYALVDGQFIEAENSEELLKKLKDYSGGKKK